ncbi:MAG: ATP-grasp domain-containing protein, partial [Clostridia bacterium]|nr:ATP-grasp domain-containing protein [Clostridia bacterium]
PTLPYATLTECDYRAQKEEALARVEDSLGYPVIVKPARLGSSIGVKVAQDRNELTNAVESGFSFDKTLLIEQYLPDKRDINCAAYALNGKIFVSECEEPLSQEEILSFKEKYLDGGKTRRAVFPANIPKAVAEEVKFYTEKLYKTLSLSGMVRADFLLSGEKVYFNELNTVPGSLAYYLFSPKISHAKRLFESLIAEAIATYSKPTLLPETGILTQATALGSFGGVKK